MPQVYGFMYRLGNIMPARGKQHAGSCGDRSDFFIVIYR